MVLLRGAAGDDVVVEVGEDEGQVAEEHVHEPLEGLRGVAEAERHEQVFKEAERRYNGRFWNVSRVHWNLVVPLDEVDEGEELASVQFVGEVEDNGQGVAVVFCGEV